MVRDDMGRSGLSWAVGLPWVSLLYVLYPRYPASTCTLTLARPSHQLVSLCRFGAKSIITRRLVMFVILQLLATVSLNSAGCCLWVSCRVSALLYISLYPSLSLSFFSLFLCNNT